VSRAEGGGTEAFSLDETTHYERNITIGMKSKRAGKDPVKNATDRKECSHEKIRAAAARLLRRDGLRGASVRKVMAAAGLTGGGFYAHFRSKEALLADAFSCAAHERRKRLTGPLGDARGASYVDRFLGAYLSADHRDNLQDSCPYSALLSELPRAGRSMRSRVREDFAAAVKAFADRLDLNEPQESRRMAILVLCLSFGALAMSRTLDGYPEADELLTVASAASRYWRVC
jgi:TetR/AcrR family transcriptional regulator, transcriptional repressor for nem operon